MADSNTAIKLNPNNAYAFYARGYAGGEEKNSDSVIADYTQAIRFDLNFVLAYNNRGNSYQAKGDTARANADYAKAKELGF